MKPIPIKLTDEHGNTLNDIEADDRRGDYDDEPHTCPAR